MATESPVRLLSPSNSTSWATPSLPTEDLHFISNWRERESVPKRSDSAPPVIEGSWTSFTNLINYEENLRNLDKSEEEQLRSNPAYLDYYNSRVNLNPRLPPPLIKREGRHLLHRICNNNNNDGNSDNASSLDIQRSVLSTHNEETEDEKSPRNMDEFQGSPIPSPPFEDPSNPSSSVSTELAPELDTCQPPISSWTPSLNPNPNPSSSSPSSSEKSPSLSGKSKLMPDTKPLVVTDLAKLEAEMKGLSVNFPYQMKGVNVNFHNPPPPLFVPRVDSSQQPVLQQTGNISTPFYTPNNNLSNFGSGLFYPPNPNPNSFFAPQYSLTGLSGYPLNHNFVPPVLPNYPPQNPIASAGLTGGDFLQPYKFYSQMGPVPPVPPVPAVPVQSPIPDPNFVQFFQQQTLNPYPIANPYNSIVTKPMNMDLFSPGLRPISVNPNPFRKMGVPLQYQSASPRRNESCQNFRGEFRNLAKFEDSNAKPFSFLEELKSNRNRRFELSDISGRIVEFSADQHGSRFIQQKLENSSAEEKASVFNEILPHATSLMTDVFGNYVIQKFFEYGNKEQKRELANKLVGHILPLSLQMYGCRVIQKALEVIEMEQKRELVRELEGHEMHCVRDQNGNHVIQKCIERVPAQHIGFIINAFKGQVAGLSMHPYGCRVIQRVLEHCTDDPLGQCIVDEILQSACILAQDQYGNYVTQHVLEKGKLEERSEIIRKLAGQVVIMSQNKYASNVIEKCFQHGSDKERDILICGIIEQTEGNDNLLVMMKDQYANYVVQKILETCDANQREVLLNRVRNHLPALRKYTYGKHIVARVDQLLSEGNNVYGA